MLNSQAVGTAKTMRHGSCLPVRAALFLERTKFSVNLLHEGVFSPPPHAAFRSRSVLFFPRGSPLHWPSTQTLGSKQCFLSVIATPSSVFAGGRSVAGEPAACSALKANICLLKPIISSISILGSCSIGVVKEKGDA